ncbi:MAG: response regulator receiver protein [Methanohalophilus sp. T328-1]|uniref:CheY chemotaxis protein or a CheY-like REC (Receiver) domain n=1 Tax=Methanohalophilus euhalobius TaxID=51203 RepID=A0A285EK11_9EURY|nr:MULTISPECIES: response regulator [Methanohalophilus]KXS44290.1 MAG: response regulator receiver protein [Methanohalophilus sp. T328-1]ODV48772.1 MAG: response regulator receiver protein [Methanohalophilus sp. 2-GBenrich]RXG33409.1 response regulator receiver protein [Methanohalophilus sp. WG1-DM]TCL10968.1 CheY-like chemotaxis protein [Methanohalophilus euhalobius]SNX99472.1 CheY chemotaxis protein or a CheY-like REC (receiver) domain [Methanohalophilus euhalobius]
MKKSRILVVEDEAIVAMVIKRRLQDLGYIVSGVASTGKDAITKVEGTFPDLVLMDIRLKGDMDGIEATKTIKDRFSLPVVYLTAHSDDVTFKKAKETDPDGYILKPFTEKDLSTTIEIALHKFRKEKGN